MISGGRFGAAGSKTKQKRYTRTHAPLLHFYPGECVPSLLGRGAPLVPHLCGSSAAAAVAADECLHNTAMFYMLCTVCVWRWLLLCANRLSASPLTPPSSPNSLTSDACGCRVVGRVRTRTTSVMFDARRCKRRLLSLSPSLSPRLDRHN